jgi:TolB-like protein
MNSYHCPHFIFRLRTQATLLFYACFTLITCLVVTPNIGQSTESPSTAQNSQQDQQNIIILPFEIQTKTPHPHLQSGLANILATRVSQKTGHSITTHNAHTEKLADLLRHQGNTAVQEVIQKTGNTYLLAGTLKEQEQGYEMSIQAFGQHPTARISFSQTFNRLDQALSAANELSLDIAEKFFSVSRPKEAQLAAETDGLEGFHTAHPERIFREKKYSAKNFEENITESEIKTSDFGILSAKKDALPSSTAVAMAVADLNNDGKNEFIILERANLALYHKTPDASFQRIAFQPLARHLALHAMYLADFDQNGLQEIYIGASNGTIPASQILEWDGTFRILYQNAPYYLRPGIDAQGQPILLGQENIFKENGNNTFYSLQREANGSLRKKERIPVHPGFNIYDFVRADLDLDGTPEFIGITRGNKLTVIDNTGRTLWKSEKNYGTSKEILGALSRTIDGDRDQSNNPDPVYMHTRIMAWDLNNDGTPEIILGRNRLAKITFLKRLRSFEGSSITALRWDGNAMNIFWESPRLAGYTVDFQMTREADQPHRVQLFSLEQEYTTGNIIPFWKSDKESLVHTYILEGKKNNL